MWYPSRVEISGDTLDVITRDELIDAARWTTTQNPSPGYRMVLKEALSFLGVEDADLGA